MRREYLKLSWVKPSSGLRQLTARIVVGGGPKPKRIIYPSMDDPCTEKGRFVLYVAGRRGELRLRMASQSPRRLRRFLRDFVKSRGGAVWSTNYWRTLWR
ncbi:hypothetical protein ES702_05327 [subsurface metagenome]